MFHTELSGNTQGFIDQVSQSATPSVPFVGWIAALDMLLTGRHESGNIPPYHDGIYYTENHEGQSIFILLLFFIIKHHDAI